MRIIVFLIAFATSFNLSAQDDHEHDVNHDHHQNEFGIANAPVYFLKEKEISYGLHMHLVHNISDTKFGIGLGYERIFDDHKHTTIGLVATYRPIDKLSLNVSPGVTVEGGYDPAFAVHVETSYEFELNDFHIGPVLEFAYDPEDIHLSLGLHIGIGF